MRHLQQEWQEAQSAAQASWRGPIPCKVCEWRYQMRLCLSICLQTCNNGRMSTSAGSNALQCRNSQRWLVVRRQHPRPPAPETLRIYEAHVGMSSEEEKVASYTYFKGAPSQPGG